MLGKWLAMTCRCVTSVVLIWGVSEFQRVQAGEDPAQADPEAREIMNLRERLGQRIFEGTLFERKPKPAAGEASIVSGDDDEAAIFSRTLQRMARSPAQEKLTLPGPMPTPLDAGSDSPLSEAARRPAARHFARQLDLLAADFEEQEFYDEADRLRSMARALRLRYRGSLSKPTLELPESQTRKSPAGEPVLR